MKYDEIMKEITSGLSGDYKNDIEYLMKQGEKHKNHEFGKEISRGIGRLIFDIIPIDKREEFNKIFNNHNLGTEKIIEEIDFQIYQKNFIKALSIIESLINKIEDLGWYKEDGVSQYFCFNNLLEELIYKEYFKSEKEIRVIPEDYAAIYFKFGSILFELKKYKESKRALEKAIFYNPVKTDILFELSEIYKQNKNWDKYLEINKQCLNFAYSSQALARCYRNLGFYYIEQSNYDLAISLFQLSLNFDQETKIAQSELLYISQKSGKEISKPNVDNIIKLLKENDIQLGANKLILSIAITIGQQAQKEDEYETAKYFYSVFYDLTGDDDIKKIIDSLIV
jgi:tetratricopeptide (TPR) repeat protein